MKNNVVITIFDIESEAYQAFNQLTRENVGKGYTVAEAVLVKNKANTIDVIDGFGVEPADADTATGIVIGSLVGVLGGPIGVILGAAVGGLAGNSLDSDRAVDTASAVAVVADKIFEGEIAIAALVNEDEPAFDAVFNDYKTTILRYDAADVAEDVDRMKELEEELSNQAMAQIEADRKAEREARRAEREKKIQEQIDEYVAATNRTMADVQPM